MALILARSPFFVERGNLDEGASLQLEIGSYSGDEGFEVEKTFNLNFRNAYSIDISPLIKDYLGLNSSYISGNWSVSDREIRYVRTTLSGEIGGVAQADDINEYHATLGYLYSTDDYNEEFASQLKEVGYYAGSSDVVYKLDDGRLRVPFLATDVTLTASPTIESLSVLFMNEGDVVATYNTSFSAYETLSTQIGLATSNPFESFLNRINSGTEGVNEDTNCSSRFFRQNITEPIDEVRFVLDGVLKKTIKVKTIEECKYNPYRVTFRNRFGALEDLWFFKRSSVSINTSKERYRSNSIARHASFLNEVKTFIDFNVNGVERITLNSGWVDERLNESFRQLMLSEDVELYDFKNDKTYQVNVGSSDLRFKDHVTDKVINYEIEFEMAHEVINNVG